jgi:hypothetical protein
VFCAVLAWSRLRFVRFAADEKSVITLGMLGECFAELGGAPQVMLVGRMGSLKAGVQTLGGCPVQLVVLLNPCRRTEATDETRRAVASTTFARGVVITLDRDNRDQIRDQDATGRSRTGRDGWDVAAVASAMNGDRRHGSGGMGRGSPCS